MSKENEVKNEVETKKRKPLLDKLHFHDGKFAVADKKLESFIKKELLQLSLKSKKTKAIIEEKFEGYINLNVSITLTPSNAYMEGKND